MYDESGHLIGEYTISGSTVTTVQETAWLGDIPVATFRGTLAAPSAYYVHTDQLNTPRKITNASNQLRWSWDPTPFGEGTPVENPNPPNQGVFKFNLRFPGQYFDSESNLNYNYYRDYDPATGRFSESDPIGIWGGINTFAYTKSNPIILVDPEGLMGLGAGPSGKRRSRECTTDEWKICEQECGSRGVRTCKMPQLFTVRRAVQRDGRVLIDLGWKDLKLSCDCNPCDSMEQLAEMIGISAGALWTLDELTRLFPPRNAVPFP